MRVLRFIWRGVLARPDRIADPAVDPDLDDTTSAGQYRRIEGTLSFEAVYWAPRETGRGGHNYSGAGVLVALPSGGEALLLAESLSVPDFVNMMNCC